MSDACRLRDKSGRDVDIRVSDSGHVRIRYDGKGSYGPIPSLAWLKRHFGDQPGLWAWLSERGVARPNSGTPGTWTEAEWDDAGYARFSWRTSKTTLAIAKRLAEERGEPLGKMLDELVLAASKKST